MTTPKKYRKKPVIIEAIQWTGDNPYAVRAFTGEHNTGVGTHMVFTTQSGHGELYVAANDKWLDIEVGEWIIRDSRGFYPCKPDIFEATYEEPTDGDEHHSLDELYDYRMAYNALTFNMWARLGMYDVHKSWKHSDGEPCFGGGWFIVNATTPHGLVSNHYPEKYWDLFSMEHRETPVEYDGHTPQEALQRLIATAEDQKYMELINE